MSRASLLLAACIPIALAACPSTSRPVERRGRPSGADGAAEEDAAPARASRREERPARLFRAQVAGPSGFYTSSADELRGQVDGFLRDAEESAALRGRDLVGLLAPHAGYRYSGPTAGFAYRQLRGRSYRTVVLLALAHRASATRVALLDYDAYETPLGAVPIDRDLVARLAAAAPDVFETSERVFRGEHSLEIQIPMLQRALEGEYSIVPIILATHDETHCEQVAQVLFEQLGNRRDVLFIASSDLSHFHPYEEARTIDQETLGLVTRLDIAEYRRRGPRPRDMPCGYFPLLALMELFTRYDEASRRATLLRYQNSGDTAGDRSRVVGYGAVAFSLDAGTRPEAGPPAAPISRDDRQALMDLARASVRAAVSGSTPTPPRPSSAFLRERGAAFVTLRCDTNTRGRCVGPGDDLRGCIGHVVARVPLYQCVTEVAGSAAVSDRRFPRLTEEELRHISYQISVLTPPEPVSDPEEIVVGRDGLIMTRGSSTGLLLPQVPIEWGWDRVTFLERTCHKAHMEPGCWQDPRTRIERFGAIVFDEDLVIREHRRQSDD